MINIPSLSLSGAVANPQCSMQFARADDSIVLALNSVGSLNWLYAIYKANQSWAYAFIPTGGVTVSGDPITKCRLLFNNGVVTGAWVDFGPVAAGVWFITGLNITSFTYTFVPIDTGADYPPQVATSDIEVAAGAFVGTDLEVVAEKFSCGDHVITISLSNDPPLDPPSPAVATKMRYMIKQTIDGNIDWEGVIGADSKLRKYT
jgi:hypothetical protein